MPNTRMIGTPPRRDQAAFAASSKLQHENSVVAIRTLHGPASFVLQTLQIATWQDGAPFIFDDQGTLHTGTCEVFGN
jgi:hypothetical protein